MRLSVWTVGAAYLLSLLLILVPLTESVAGTLPFQWGDVRWRFAAAGLVSRGLITPMIGATLVVGLATALEHQVLLRLASAFLVLFGLAVGGSLILFAADTLSMREIVDDNSLGAIYLASGTACVKMIAVSAISLALALGSHESSRNVRRSRQLPDKSMPLVTSLKSGRTAT